MYQNWHELLFLHADFDPDEIQKLLPPGLTVDTFPNAAGEPKAWIGLVCFRMQGIRPKGLPALPWISAFPETNVRTYVTRNGRDPGVWFFTLDAARWLACRVARASYKLPYLHASMSVRRDGDHITYESQRKEKPAAELRIEAALGPKMPTPQPGSFEFFLIERYLLYSQRGAELYSGQVHHVPYPLREATISSCSQGLVDAIGVRCGEWQHTCFSEGVDVEVFGLRPLSNHAASSSS
jgi:uncharacterized protein YqjF (DUF2071 family)